MLLKGSVYDYASINRTFMELKLVLNRPTPGPQKRINRTFMELKLCYCWYYLLYYHVLIEPLWN